VESTDEHARGWAQEGRGQNGRVYGHRVVKVIGFEVGWAWVRAETDKGGRANGGQGE